MHSACIIYYGVESVSVVVEWSEKQQNIVATSEAVIVCIDQKTLQKTQIPEHIRKKIEALELTAGHEI